MDWIVVAKCDECTEEKTYEVSGNTLPYSIGDAMEYCMCGGQFIVEEILKWASWILAFIPRIGYNSIIYH